MVTSKNKLVFIIGLRRSGSSILRRLIEMHPDILKLEFEPHELLFCASTHHIGRYQHSEYHKRILNQYKGHESKYFGAKLVLNPGLETFSWKFLPRIYPEAKFIFINRDCKDTYKSWYKQDHKSVRGVIDENLYESFYAYHKFFFDSYQINHKDSSIIIQYEDLIKDADKTLEPVWKMLNLREITDLNKFIKQPEFK